MVDIVYINGNYKYGTASMHSSIRESILSELSEFNIEIIESDDINMVLPKAKVYIGFSRGTRYMKKLPEESLKICLGGKKCNENNYINTHDRTFKGVLSRLSLDSHFTINKKHLKVILIKIKEHILNKEGKYV